MAKFAAGYGEKVITPPLGTELCGYGFYLNRRAESVLDDLKTRAVVLKHGTESLALISADLIGFTIKTADEIRATIARSLKIPTENILLACTHTHTGPATLPMPGLGDIDPAYAATLPGAVGEAVSKAADDLADAEFSFGQEAVEPIGYNRRLGSFDGIDPYLKTGFLRRKKDSIYLFNYACHAVTLGRSTQVSADWPGALVREAEKRGSHALVFQGYCGDIDPVVFLNRWGGGTRHDLEFCAGILWDRAAKCEDLASKPDPPSLRTREQRIRVPLSVCRKDEIEAEAAFFYEKNKSFPLADRFAEEWKKAAYERHEEFWEKPYMEDVPVQALAVGGWKIIALPGEVFSSFSLNLRKEFPGAATVGYANGLIGYVPASAAFQDFGDYACYCAPRFYTIFPFTADIERIFLKESTALLRAVGG